MKISRRILEIFGAQRREPENYGLPEFPRGVKPDRPTMADDSAGLQYYMGTYSAGFPGFQELALLSQLPEYRMMVETLAKEMTRAYVKISSTNDDRGKIEIILNAMRKYRVQEVIRKAIEHDGYFGRGNIFIDTGAANPDEPLIISNKTVPRKSLRGFRVIEPMWMYPGVYNANDPTAPDFFLPTKWHVMGKQVDASRFLIVRAREVSDILKPAYAFCGLSISQVAKPYVDNWTRTRDSVSNLLHSFSLTILKTNMTAELSEEGSEGAENLNNRMRLFNAIRDNRGLMACDKETEEIEQINTPLGTLDALQSQSLEQLAVVSHIPLVKLLGTTPNGLGATAEPEIRAFYDWVEAEQQAVLRAIVEKILKIIQLSEFGEIDEGITFDFCPLWQMSDSEISVIRKTNAEIDGMYYDMGVVSSDEIRARLISDETSGYYSLAEMADELDEDFDEDFADAEAT